MQCYRQKRRWWLWEQADEQCSVQVEFHLRVKASVEESPKAGAGDPCERLSSCGLCFGILVGLLLDLNRGHSCWDRFRIFGEKLLKCAFRTLPRKPGTFDTRPFDDG